MMHHSLAVLSRAVLRAFTNLQYLVSPEWAANAPNESRGPMPGTVEPTRLSRAANIWAALIVPASLICGGPALAITLLRAETGQWDLTLEHANKSCRVTLRAGPATGGGRSVGMPAGCRKALPVLGQVEAWSLVGDDHIELADKAGTPVLDFVAQSDEIFVASGPQGESYRLESVEHGLPQKASPASAPVKTADAAKAPGTAPMRLTDAAGRYSILREAGKDTGCMLTLDDKSAAKGGFKASLAPACRDQGIVIFDPVGWRLAGGRLELTARKGHSAQFDLQPDGTWLKDPKQGKGLGLKKQ